MCVSSFFVNFLNMLYRTHKNSYTIFLVQKGIYFLALKAIVSMAVLALGCSKPLRCLKNVWFWGRRTKHVKNIFQFNKICKCVNFSPFVLHTVRQNWTTLISRIRKVNIAKKLPFWFWAVDMFKFKLFYFHCMQHNTKYTSNIIIYNNYRAYINNICTNNKNKSFGIRIKKSVR